MSGHVVCKGFKYIAQQEVTRPYPKYSSVPTMFVRPVSEQRVLDLAKSRLSKWKFAIVYPAMIFWFWWNRK